VVFDEYAGQVAPIEWHFWGGDPFYTFTWATADIQARSAYYGGWDYVPHFRYDGKKISDLFGTNPNYPEFFIFLRNTLDSLLTIPSPYRINLQQSFSADWDSVYVIFDVVAVDTIIDDTTPDLYLAVVEKYHTYPGYAEWDYSFRDMKPDGDGEMITIQKGDSLHFNWAYPINAIYNLDGVITTVFVQNDPDASVINPKMRNKVMQSASALATNVSGVSIGDTPSVVWMGQAAPNPAASGTRIAYALGMAGKVRLSVYAPTGQLVTRLVDAEHEPGSYSAAWDGRDGGGNRVSSGMYYYKLDALGEVRTGRVVILK
jgi:hypothetical protein